MALNNTICTSDNTKVHSSIVLGKQNLYVDFSAVNKLLQRVMGMVVVAKDGHFVSVKSRVEGF